MRFKNSVAVAAGGALGFAAFVILRRGDKPRERRHLYAGGFVLGYALFVALLLVLDAVFPPLT